MFDFPDIGLHADELAVKRHVDYGAAKSGDMLAAARLVSEFVNDEVVQQIGDIAAGQETELVAIHALESGGVNEIPAELAKLISGRLALSVNSSIVQSNSVGHTGASGFRRLANQAIFAGDTTPGRNYFLVDDFVGQGGTLANLIGFLVSQGGRVLGATVLTGKTYSAKLAPDVLQIQALRNKHGTEFEIWWERRFGFSFDCLTRSEARYLERSADADTIRNRLAEAGLEHGA